MTSNCFSRSVRSAEGVVEWVGVVAVVVVVVGAWWMVGSVSIVLLEDRLCSVFRKSKPNAFDMMMNVYDWEL